MKIAVTGGTGFIGRPLVAKLIDAGHEVAVWTRDTERATAVLPARACAQPWDPSEASVPSLEGFDAIIHLAGAGVADKRWSAKRKKEILSSRVQSTAALARALEKLPRAKRPTAFVCASAIGFYGNRGDEELDENSAPGEGFLSEVCQEWENQARAVESLGIRTVITRIGVVLGRGGGALRQLLPPFRLGVGGRVGSGKQWMSWIHRDDMVDLLAFCVESDNVRGIFNAVAPQTAQNKAFTKALGHTLRRPTLFPIPALALRIAFGEMASVLLHSQRVRPEAVSRLGFRFRFGDLPSALADLCSDFDEILEVEQWIPRSVDALFPFYADPYNLEAITPDFLRFRVLRSTDGLAREGTIIDYRLRLRGIPLGWQTRIEEWQPTSRFVDVQVRGPYALWHHTHEFQPHADGTLVLDRVRYRLPFGALGALVGGRWVRRDVEHIFRVRYEKMKALFRSFDERPNGDERMAS